MVRASIAWRLRKAAASSSTDDQQPLRMSSMCSPPQMQNTSSPNSSNNMPLLRRFILTQSTPFASSCINLTEPTPELAPPTFESVHGIQDLWTTSHQEGSSPKLTGAQVALLALSPSAQAGSRRSPRTRIPEHQLLARFPIGSMYSQ